MSFGSYNPGSRYRQRSQRRVASLVFGVLFFVIAFGLGYSIGTLRVGQGHYILQQQKATLEEQNTVMQDEVTQLRAEARTANIRLEQLKANYDEILSAGPMQDIVALLKKQIDSGVDITRLESVILSARPPKNCSDPKSKRFLLVTPSYQGPESKISIESGLISIWGQGESSRNSDENVEAWFDPTKPVKIFFQPRNGKLITKEGALPFFHSIVEDGKEYRFTIAADAKSFAKITYDFCDYP